MGVYTEQIYELIPGGSVPAVRVGRPLCLDPTPRDRSTADGGPGFAAGWRNGSAENHRSALLSQSQLTHSCHGRTKECGGCIAPPCRHTADQCPHDGLRSSDFDEWI